MLSQTDPARAARLSLEGLLAAASPPLAAGLPPGFTDAIERYVALLLSANERLNLTRIVEPAAVAVQHLLDALAALPLIDALAPAAAVDLGSGGGVPAIPLALARPDTEWTCVDSVGKKAAALREFVEALELRNVRVETARAEDLGRDPAHRERYRLATARACARLPILVEWALPLVAVGGELLAWKGPLTEADDEVRRGRVAASQLGAGPLRIVASQPALGGHRFVVVPKERRTPVMFPRSTAKIVGHPLG